MASGSFLQSYFQSEDPTKLRPFLKSSLPKLQDPLLSFAEALNERFRNILKIEKSSCSILPEDGCQVNGISVIASLVGHIQKGGNKKIDPIIAAPQDC